MLACSAPLAQLPVRLHCPRCACCFFLIRSADSMPCCSAAACADAEGCACACCTALRVSAAAQPHFITSQLPQNQQDAAAAAAAAVAAAAAAAAPCAASAAPPPRRRHAPELDGAAARVGDRPLAQEALVLGLLPHHAATDVNLLAAHAHLQGSRDRGAGHGSAAGGGATAAGCEQLLQPPATQIPGAPRSAPAPNHTAACSSQVQAAASPPAAVPALPRLAAAQCAPSTPLTRCWPLSSCLAMTEARRPSMCPRQSTTTVCRQGGRACLEPRRQPCRLRLPERLSGLPVAPQPELLLAGGRRGPDERCRALAGSRLRACPTGLLASPSEPAAGHAARLPCLPPPDHCPTALAAPAAWWLMLVSKEVCAGRAGGFVSAHAGPGHACCALNCTACQRQLQDARNSAHVFHRRSKVFRCDWQSSACFLQHVHRLELACALCG